MHKGVHIIRDLAIIVFCIVGSIILYKYISPIPFNYNPELTQSDYVTYTSNYLGYATLIVTGFGIFVASLSLFSFYQYHKITEIRKETDSIFENKKSEIFKIQAKHTKEIFTLFSASLIPFTMIHKDFTKYLETIFKPNLGLTLINDKIDHNFSLINNLILINSTDPEEVRKSLFAISSLNRKEMICVVEAMIKINEDNPSFQVVVLAAKQIIIDLKRMN